MSIYEECGVTPVINAGGYRTRFGGSLMLPEVVAAMAEAARSFVVIAELEEAAGRLIAEATGAETGYVTSGSAAALTLAAAACIGGTDRDRINRLPDAAGVRHEIAIPGPHRDSYDRCFRAAGATIVTAGTPARCTRDELAAAVGPETVAVGWFSAYEASSLPLAEVAAVAHARGAAVIVDAAIALPPADNLRRFVREGADLVAFSGGKDLRGPQASGILAGRADLLASVPLQHQDFAANDGSWNRDRPLLSPGHGIGRAMKVGKEEIAGLLVALRLYLARDHAAEVQQQEAQRDSIAQILADLPGVRTEMVASLGQPALRVIVDPAGAGLDAFTAVRRLSEGSPRVAVAGSTDRQSPFFTIVPATLQPGEAAAVAERVRAVLGRAPAVTAPV